MTPSANELQKRNNYDMKHLISIILTVIISENLLSQDLTAYVNPFIGTSNGGNTNPGSCTPWGMMSLSPFNSYDTVIMAATGPSPYYYGKKYISGFTHMNMSGVGCGDMGIICLMPTTGNFSLHQPDNTSAYSGERANPGYYSAILDRFNVKAELTTTTRTGLSCYTFPSGKSNILLNLGIGVTTQKGGMLKLVSDTEVEGLKSIGNICGIKSVQTVYFVARISKKPVISGVWIDGKDYPGFNREIAGNDIGAYFTFETEANEAIYVKVGVSYVSIANARINLDSEQPGYDFDSTKMAAGQVWNKELSKILVEGGTGDDKIKFYTALYHTLIQPSTACDVNGDYSTMGANKTAKAGGYNRYTVFSLWDTYRNVHPFLSLVYPKQQSDIVKSILGMYKEGGWLPKWEFAGLEFYDMVGDPVVPVIADSYLRGIMDFDIELAFAAMKHNASIAENGNPVRPGLEDFLKSGYIPLDAACVFNPVTDYDKVYMWENLNTLKLVWGPVSTSMEYCIADWNIAQIAKKLGYTDDYKLFSDRALYYRNYFDKQTGFIRPKLKDGSWLNPFDPSSENGFTEGGSWNYTFMVPHDITGLIKLMGGEKAYISRLTECFEKGHYYMANEPDIAYPYLFNHVKGEEWRTQKYVRECVNKYFLNSPDGIWGNDDCGTMSTWLMYAMMGFYPDCPGNMNYQLASPVFSKITVALDPEYYPGKTFVIEAQNSGKNNCYVQSMEFNSKIYNKFTISHQDIIKGGRLVYKLDNNSRNE
jgi:predicted alpha-1,2-mannosidase